MVVPPRVLATVAGSPISKAQSEFLVAPVSKASLPTSHFPHTRTLAPAGAASPPDSPRGRRGAAAGELAEQRRDGVLAVGRNSSARRNFGPARQFPDLALLARRGCRFAARYPVAPRNPALRHIGVRNPSRNLLPSRACVSAGRVPLGPRAANLEPAANLRVRHRASGPACLDQPPP